MGMELKKYFIIGMGVILVLALGIIGYGAYMNITDENQIANLMDNRALEVQGAKAQQREIIPRLKLDYLRLSAENMTDAVSLIDGRITAMYVQPNQPVRQGQVLVHLVNEEIPMKLNQAEGDIRKAEAALTNAESNYYRYGRLLARNAASQEKYEEAEAQYKSAQAAVAQAEAARDQLRVSESYQDVIAPIDGEVVMLYKNPGSFVTAGTSVAMVGDFSRLTCTLSSEYSDEEIWFLQRFVQQDMLLSVSPEKMDKAYGSEYATGNFGYEQKFPVHLVSITPELSQAAVMRSIVLEIDNSTHLLEPLIYRDVIFQTVQKLSCLCVPEEALIGKNQNTVFTVDEDGIVHLREVHTGLRDNDYVEILSGVAAGETVIISDKDGLQDGMRVHVTMKEGEE